MDWSGEPTGCLRGQVGGQRGNRLVVIARIVGEFDSDRLRWSFRYGAVQLLYSPFGLQTLVKPYETHTFRQAWESNTRGEIKYLSDNLPSLRALSIASFPYCYRNFISLCLSYWWSVVVGFYDVLSSRLGNVQIKLGELLFIFSFLWTYISYDRKDVIKKGLWMCQ